MNKYEVLIKRTQINKMEVEAKNRREASRIVKDTLINSKLLDIEEMNKEKPKVTIRIKNLNK